MTEKLNRWAESFQSNIYVKAISSAMMGLMALMMISSIVVLAQAGINFAGLTKVLGPFIAVFTQINNMTLNVISLFVAFLVAYRLAEEMGKDAVNAGIMGLMAFLILSPLTNIADPKFSGIAISVFGSAGMFPAIIGGLIAARLYIFFVDHKLVINLPESVPPIVAKGFAAIIPGLLVALFFGAIYYLMSLTAFGTFGNLVLWLVQAPLNALGNNVITALILVAFAEFLWFFGIHGSMAIQTIMMVLYLQPQMANLEAFNAGSPLPFLLTMGFIFGNRGARSMAVSIHCLFTCKSERLKAVGKVGVVPALFGISEPIKFGVPQVMNIRMLAPLMITPVVSLLSAYILAVIGFLPYHNGVSIPLGFPIILGGFLTQGWQGVVAQLLQLFLCFLVYIPFMRAEDKTACVEEAEYAAQQLA